MARNLFDILEENNVKLSKSSIRWVAVCPFHEGDRSPSFTVYPNETYFCFGCKVWGDAVKFLVDYKGMAYKDALVEVGVEGVTRKRKGIIKTRDLVSAWYVMYHAANIYHSTLMDTAGAREYLFNRGLTLESIRRYTVGYCSGADLDLTALEAKVAIEVGLMNDSGFELLSHRITIPNILDLDKCDFITGRTVTNSNAKYLNTSTPKTLYGFLDLKDEPMIFLVEGHFDWLLMKQMGYPTTVAGGTHVTRQNLAILETKRVIIVPDNDKVGQTSAERIHKVLPNSYIFDYSEMGLKDVGEVGAAGEDAVLKFNELMMEQTSWNSHLSRMPRDFPGSKKDLTGQIISV